MAWFTFPVRLVAPACRDDLRAFLAREGIESGVYFQPVHELPFHDRHHLRESLAVTEDIGRCCLALPLFPRLAGEDVDRVVDAVKRFLA